MIIFKDSDEPFSPDTIKSEFNRKFLRIFLENNNYFSDVFAVVTPDRSVQRDTTYYKYKFPNKNNK